MYGLDEIIQRNREVSRLMSYLGCYPYIADKSELMDLAGEVEAGEMPRMPFPFIGHENVDDLVGWELEEVLKVELFPGAEVQKGVLTVKEFLETASDSHGYGVLEVFEEEQYVEVGKFIPIQN